MTVKENFRDALEREFGLEEWTIKEVNGIHEG